MSLCVVWFPLQEVSGCFSPGCRPAIINIIDRNHHCWTADAFNCIAALCRAGLPDVREDVTQSDGSSYWCSALRGWLGVVAHVKRSGSLSWSVGTSLSSTPPFSSPASSISIALYLAIDSRIKFKERNDREMYWIHRGSLKSKVHDLMISKFNTKTAKTKRFT